MQARDLGSTRQALKKRLYGTGRKGGRKGTVPITEKRGESELSDLTAADVMRLSPPGIAADRTQVVLIRSICHQTGGSRCRFVW